MRFAWLLILATTATSAQAVQLQSPPVDKQPECALSDIIAIDPGDRLQLMDDFRESLASPDRRRLDKALPRDAGGGIAKCDNIDRSLASCEAAAYIPALQVTGLMPRFRKVACLTYRRDAAISHSAPTFIPHHTMPAR
jgi:hypothetical protein